MKKDWMLPLLERLNTRRHLQSLFFMKPDIEKQMLSHFSVPDQQNTWNLNRLRWVPPIRESETNAFQTRQVYLERGAFNL